MKNYYDNANFDFDQVDISANREILEKIVKAANFIPAASWAERAEFIYEQLGIDCPLPIKQQAQHDFMNKMIVAHIKAREDLKALEKAYADMGKALESYKRHAEAGR